MHMDIWRYKEDALGSIDNIDPRNIAFNKIIQYDLEGNRLNEFSTYIEAKRALNLKTSTGVMACCLGNQQTCNGYAFKLEPTYTYFDVNLYEEVINKYKGFINKNLINRSIKINCFNLDNQLVCTFNSFLEAERFIGIHGSRSRIKKCCKGDLTSYKNYIWKYAQVDLKPV